MTAAGGRSHRLAFDKRVEGSDDGYGNTTEGWDEQFLRWGEMTPLRRGEAVQAARLQGVQPYVVAVLADHDTRQITPDWRARDLNTGRAFNIRTVEFSNDRAKVEMLVEQGVAHG